MEVSFAFLKADILYQAISIVQYVIVMQVAFNCNQ
jgi:hypothetical protein